MCRRQHYSRLTMNSLLGINSSNNFPIKVEINLTKEKFIDLVLAVLHRNTVYFGSRKYDRCDITDEFLIPFINDILSDRDYYEFHFEKVARLAFERSLKESVQLTLFDLYYTKYNKELKTTSEGYDCGYTATTMRDEARASLWQ